MEKRYYLVDVKCGHVGKNYYVIKTLPIVASDSHEATYKARWTPRVKHDEKDAIISLVEVDEDKYKEEFEKQQQDQYFHCDSNQEQSYLCPENKIERIIEPSSNTVKEYALKIKSKYKELKEKLFIKDAYDEYLEYQNEYAY